MQLVTNFLSIPMIFRNSLSMPYTVDNTVICVIVLLAISYLYTVIIMLIKQYILIHSLIIENNGVF